MKKNQLYIVVASSLMILMCLIYQGAYAYFTAAVGGSGNTTKNTSNVTTVSLGEIKYDGTLVFNGTGIYPGYKEVQVFTIGPDKQTGNGIYEIDLEASVPSTFGSDIEITLYKTTNPSVNNVIRTEGTLVQSNNQYEKEDTIAINGNPEKVYQGILENNLQIILEQSDFEVPGIKNTTYYLVYNYKNNGVQDSQQGLSFQGKVTVRYIAEKKKEFATTYLSSLASNNDPSLAYDGTVDNNLRYIGANPNNYISFNNELWRIIGVMNNIDDGSGNKASRLKIIRNESIGNYSWDSSDSSINSGAGINEWSVSDLNTLLNDYYYNAKSDQTCYNGLGNLTIPCDFSSTGIIEENSKELIDTVVWNTGSNKGSDEFSYTNSPARYYENERSNLIGWCSGGPYCNDNVIRKTLWTGKIGLMYPSDYGFATSGGITANRDSCLAGVVNNWDVADYSDCRNNDWLYNSLEQWTITPNIHAIDWDTASGAGIITIQAGGGDIFISACGNNSVRPTLYLKTDVAIVGGDGSLNAPFQIK